MKEHEKYLKWQEKKDLKSKSTAYKQAMWALRELKLLTNKLFKK